MSDEQLGRLVELGKSADSVELKLTVPEAAHRSTAEALGMDPLDAQIRQVYFFDTRDLLLLGSGVVARARRVQGRADDSVVKLRPVNPADLPGELRASKSMVVEIDATPEGYVCSATLKAKLGVYASAVAHPASSRSASCSQRSSGPSSPPMLPRGWIWTTSRS